MSAEPSSAADPVRTFRRRLTVDVDPLAAFRHLTDDGRAPGAQLFETARTGTAMIVVGAALTITVRGESVEVRAPLPPARPVLAALADSLPDAKLDDGLLHLRRSHADSRGGPDLEERARLEATSCLDVVRAVRAQLGASGPPLFGTFGYDLLDAFEALPPGAAEREVADLFLVVPSVLVRLRPAAHVAAVMAYGFGPSPRDPEALGRLHRVVEALGTCPAETEPAPREAPAPEPAVDLDDDAYARAVTRCQELIREGQVFQIVPSRTFRAPCPDPVGAFGELRRREAAPYRFFVRHPDGVLFGASPEAALTVTDRRLRVTPLAGTRPRGQSSDADDRMRADLLLDDKERAEHMMLVDLARNDVARVSRPGTRAVTRLLEVERFARVMHLASEVEGELDDGLDALHALRACLHAGTLVGAPKVRAAEHLRELERTPRGLYGGAVGRVDASGDLDVAIVIRSAFVRNGQAEVRAGAGVVRASEPQAEAAETRAKASAVLRAIAVAGGAR